jgi:hypothetical protein
MKLGNSIVSALLLGAGTVSALPTILKAETCVCELIDPTWTGPPGPSCTTKAAEISKWRSLSFHRPELADVMLAGSATGWQSPVSTNTASMFASGVPNATANNFFRTCLFVPEDLA